MPMAGSLRRLSNQSLGKAKNLFLKPARGQADCSKGKRETGADDVAAIDVVHQLGIIGAPDYNTKEQRLMQLLERLPARGGGAAFIFVRPCSVASVEAVLKEQLSIPNVHIVVVSPSKALQQPRMQSNVGGCGVCWCVINFDAPLSGAEYLQRLACLHGAPASVLKVAYTFMEEKQLQGRPGKAIAAVLRRVRRNAVSAGCGACRHSGCLCTAGAVKAGKWGHGLRSLKAAELDSTLEQLQKDEEEEADDGDADMEDDGCDCHLCSSGSLVSLSYHGAPAGRFPRGSIAGVEAVYLHLRAAEDLQALAPLIAPRMSSYAGTLVCLHCLYNHTPWYGSEQVLADAGLAQPLRVVFVLAEATSWHDYPDNFTLWKGGAPWIDILDMESMNRTDKLLERLVDHEIELLGGCSERLVLMGSSQGGCQSMLRFLRSRRTLGGWVGSVTHFPTAPHTPRHWDPLLSQEPLANRERPVRLLAGERDVVFPPALALRDAERLRQVGGFTDVEVEVQEGLQHEGFADDGHFTWKPPTTLQAGTEMASDASLRAMKEVPDLAFVRKHLATMIGMPVPSSPESC